MKRILNVGSINIDYVYRVPHLVRPGETLGSRDFKKGPGGKGFNQSIALVRAGASVFHAVRYGAEAGWLRDRLAAEKIDVSRVVLDEAPAGHAIIQVDDAGQNAIVLYAGANHAMKAEHLPAIFEPMKWGDWFLTQNETSCVPEALRMAQERGLTVCFNPAPMGPAVKDYPLDVLDWLIVNETEGEMLSGEKVPAAILKKLRARSPRANVVLTLGGEGVICVTKEGAEHRVQPPRVKAVDTTAAGDAFIGFLLAAMMQEMPLENALDLACRAAAISVTRAGAADSVPWWGEVESKRA